MENKPQRRGDPSAKRDVPIREFGSTPMFSAKYMVYVAQRQSAGL